MIVNVEQKIQDIEKKIEQQRQQLRDLKTKSKGQERKDDARRKILYGVAILSAINAQSEETREKSLVKIHAHIRNAKDRAFLGLPSLETADLQIENDKAGAFIVNRQT